ncbi:MAG: sigma-70 family RNA polymerase sigma factor [Myxococcales bacterium]|nr:sigma-70 family RNA polymerase sigma factor [Myxococcales bacterium]
MHWTERYQRERGDRATVAAERLEAFVASASVDPELPLPAYVDALARLPVSLDSLSDEAAHELALAVGVAHGSAFSAQVLERDYFSLVAPALTALRLPPAMVDDVGQELRAKLLLGPTPKLVEYAGRGSLRGLIKVSATRTAISMLRKTRREADGVDDERAADDIDALDPERAILKAQYRPAFRASFERAIRGLGARERNLLRLHFVERVTLPQLASMYGVSRATVVRQLAAAREEVATETKRHLGAQLALPVSELESILDLVRSRFDVSVGGLLRTQDERDG